MSQRQQEMKRGLEQHLAQGGKIVEMPTGPLLPHFAATELASAIEYEAQREGRSRIRLDMDREDALALASYLRRAVLSGV